MAKKKEGIFKVIAFILGIGFVLLLIEIALSVFIGWLLSFFFGWDLFFCSLISFFVIMALGSLDSDDEAKCPECKRELLTSLPAKCEVCGGAARVTDKEYKKALKADIYQRKDETAN